MKKDKHNSVFNNFSDDKRVLRTSKRKTFTPFSNEFSEELTGGPEENVVEVLEKERIINLGKAKTIKK